MSWVERFRRRRRCSRGFTMMELLCALIVCLLVCGVITTALQLSSKFLLESSRDSEAQILCATLASAVKDELRYAEEVVTDASGRLSSFFSQRYGRGFRIQSDAAGHLVLQGPGGLAEETYPLVGDSAYVLDLSADFEAEYAAAEGLFHVTLRVLSPDGEVLARQEFAVARLNA